MTRQPWHNIHPDFKLNGNHYSVEDLLEVGYSLIKEGATYETSIGDFLLDWISSKPTLEVFTSGSTGRPKKIELQKQHMINSARATGTFFELKPKNKALLCLPCTSIAGKMMLVRSMILGWHLDYMEPSSSPLAGITNEYDFGAMVPLQAQNSLAYLERIKTLIIGGAQVNNELRVRLSGLSIKAFETYGMTETITHIAVSRIRAEHTHESIFEVLPDISISLDERNCLVIEGPKISDTKIVTNDVVELIDKKHFKWLGRFDTIINSGGVKLIPEQIERKLSAIIPKRFFVAGLPDDSLGQRLVLLIEDSKCDKDKLLKEIKAMKSLSKFEVPKQIFCLESFNETSSGKIQRQKTLKHVG